MLTINGRGEAGQDHFAFEHCGRSATGTFLDIGSNEPIRWNNSYALEEVGWRGWLFDIEPEYALMCAGVRKSPFFCVDATTYDWAQFKERFKAPELIDYLSLDIDENEERDRAVTILKNLFAAGFKFRCATVEHDGYRYGDNPRNAIRAVMQEADYTLAHPNVEIRKGNGKPFEDWWTL